MNGPSKWQMQKRADFEARLRLYKAGAGDRKIARALGSNRNTIKSWRRARNLPANHESAAARKIATDDMILKLYAMGAGVLLIARTLKCCHKRAMRVRDKHGLTPHPVGGSSSEVRRACGYGAARYGTRIIHLDAKLSELGSSSFHDVIACPQASSWLEEMGATVW